MIQTRVKDILEQKHMSVYRLATLTGISVVNLYPIYHNKITQIKFATLSKLCTALGITDMNELIEFIPDEQTNEDISASTILSLARSQ